MAFPIPSLLSSIEELLYEVQWLEGLIFVSESRRASFVSISQLSSLLGRLRNHPSGSLLAERLCLSLSNSYERGAAKPVLVLQSDGSFWLGLIGLGESNYQRDEAVAHLNRCFGLISGDCTSHT